MPQTQTRLQGHGIRGVLPDGWSGRIFRQRPTPPEVAGPSLHAGNFAIPLDDADYGGGDLTGSVSAGRIAVILVEFLADRVLRPNFGLYEPEGLPPALTVADFDPHTLQRGRAGQAGLQRFFTVHHRRLASLYVVAGQGPGMEKAVEEANAFIGSLEFAGSPDTNDYRPPGRRR